MKTCVSQLRSIGPTIITVAVITAVFLGLAVTIHFREHVPVGELTRDPVAVLGGAVYVGLLSQLGIFLWAAAASVNYFVAFLLAGETAAARFKTFFIVSGLISLLLGFDDVFLLHENVFPCLGIPEQVTYVVYIVIVLLWAFRFRAIIQMSDYLLLFFAGICFAGSIALDVFDSNFHGEVLVEDGLKFPGIALWTAYFFRTALAAARGKFSDNPLIPDS